jgi:hypothetical protein
LGWQFCNLKNAAANAWRLPLRSERN